MTKIILSLLFISLATATTFSNAAAPAFPGAEGFGAYTIGGRGGTIYIVTNLNDSGSGSFRAAVEATEPRIVVFEVSGTILLTSNLEIKNPYITIAGQTSPGGITIAGRMVSVWAHDVIIRHLRFRVGTSQVTYDKDENGDIIYYDQPQYSFPPSGPNETCLGNVTTKESGGMPCAIKPGVSPEMLDAFDIYGASRQDWFPGADAFNVVIDHCSFSWGADETVTFDTSAHDITFSWNSVYQGLVYAGHPKGEHSKGILLSFKEGGVYNISMHHNYIASSRGRQPFIAGNEVTDATRFVDYRNNVTLMFANNGSSAIGQNAGANLINNWLKPTENTNPTAMGWLIQDHLSGGLQNRIYMNGNRGEGLAINTNDPEWGINDQWYPQEANQSVYRKATPYPIALEYLPKTFSASSSFANCVVRAVGAMAPHRDTIDTTMALEWESSTWNERENVTYPDDYYSHPNLTPKTDTDRDGMPDQWEAANGTNPSLKDDSLYTLNPVYTNIEVYINELSDQSYNYDDRCMPVRGATNLRITY